MSTFVKSEHSAKIRSEEDLQLYFQACSKPSSESRLGIECELFAVDGETGAALPYEGEKGIRAILEEISRQFGYEPLFEGENIIALRQGNNTIALEPGGQIEFSAEPVRTVHEIKRQLGEFFFQLKTIKSFLQGIDFLTCGVHPFSPVRSIDWVPKERYKVMAKYLAKRGRLAHDMMKRTASTQVSFDYASETDAFEKMCLAMRLAPIAYALFANSAFSKGKPNGFVTERLRIWRYTDPSRSGLIMNALCPEASFQNYLNYLLDLPMLFIVRKDRWIRIPSLTFRKFIEKGYLGARPTIEDFELHLSTVFTEARFKQYLEIRSADGQRRHLIPAVAAFWKGILYDSEARQVAASLIRKWSESDFMNLYSQVEKKGLRAKARKKPVLDWTKELVKISEEGLKRQAQIDEQGMDESIYLQPLRDEVLKTKETQGERLVRLWKGQFREDRKTLIQYLCIE